MTTIRTCIFDMGNVLVRFDHSLAIQALATLCARQPEDLRRFLFDEGREWDYEKGLVSTMDFLDGLEKWCGKDLPRAAVIQACCDIFAPMPGMYELVRDVKATGCRLVLMSNTNVAHFTWIWQRYPVLWFFDSFTLSYEVQAMKPELPIYHRALAQAQVEPSACFYTDDVPDYVSVGQSLGMQAEVFVSAPVTRRYLSHCGLKL